MARILGAVASSHSPTIGFAVDAGKQKDPAWAPIFAGYEPAREWLAAKNPDVLFVVYNDHVTSFFFDHYSHFALGVGDRHYPADEGGGARALTALRGHPELARHIGASLVADEFDLAVFQDRPLDHGCFSPLSLLWPHEPDWPAPAIPLQVGALQFPAPTALRCYKLGQALRRAIESYPRDLSVVVLATGGLSHQVHGERAGFNNTEWDMRFLDLIEKDPEALTRLTHAEYARLGGMESAEVIMWLVARGALSPVVRKVHQSYYLPSMTALATAVYEDTAPAPDHAEAARQRDRIALQLRGAEELEGTYPFTLEVSARAYRVNRFLHRLVEPEHRRRFLADPETLFREAGLIAEEADMVRRRDWRAMIHYGVIFFVLEKLGAVLGISNLHIYAAMRGQAIEDFLNTRNAPGALYSVSALPGRPSWERK